MAIGTNIGIQFGVPSGMSQISDKSKQQNTTTIPQSQMMSYNITPKNPSQRFPGLEISDEEYIDKSIANLGLTGIHKKAMEEDAYKTFTEAKQARAFLDDRANIRKNIISNGLGLGKTESNMLSKQSTFVDIIREEALSKGIKTVTQIDDKTLLERAFKQNPESQKLFEDYINDKITTVELTETITGKKIEEDDTELRKEWEIVKRENPGIANMYSKTVGGSNLLRQMWNVVTGNTTTDDEVGFQTWKSEKNKSFGDVALGDFGSVPSTIVGAISAPLKVGATVIDLGGKLFNKDLQLNESIDKLTDNMGIKKDGWYNAGKIAGEIGTSMIAVTKLMQGITKIGQVANLIKIHPKIAKYIATPILEGLGYQGMTDLSKKELSSKGQYATAAILSTVMTGLSGLWGLGKSMLKDPKKYFQSAAKNVKSEFIEEISKKTDDFVVNPKGVNPLEEVIQPKVDKIVGDIAKDKGVVGEKLGKMRTQMKTITHSTDDIVKTINESLNENDIALSIKKTSKGYKADGKLLSTEGKGRILEDIVAEINSLKTIGAKDKLRGLDKVNQEIIAFMKKSNIDSSLKNALGKISGKFTKTIDDIMGQYGVTKGEYGKLANIQKIAKELSSESGETGVKKLSKIFGPKGGAEYKQFLEQLKELGYTQDDLVSEIIITNYIMASKLGKDAFGQAVESFYPSIPGLYELGIKAVKSAVVKPSKELLRFAKDYVPGTKKQIIQGVSKSLKPAIIRKKDKLGI